MQVADVKHEWLARDARVRRERRGDTERHDVDASRIDVERRHDLVARERGVGQDPVRATRAGAVERPPDWIRMMRVPLGDAGVADVMESDDQRPHAPERRTISGRVKQVEREPADRQRQRGEIPAQVRRQQRVRVEPADTVRKEHVAIGPDRRDVRVRRHAAHRPE